MKELIDLASLFDIEGTPAAVTPTGDGHINDTYFVRNAQAGAPNYVLQRVNHAIFQDIDALQDNLVKICSHIRHRLTKAGFDDLDRRTLTPIHTRDGKLYYFDGTGYWRMTKHIAGSFSHNKVTPEMARLTGCAFGEFHNYFTGDDCPELQETIPDFHNTEFRVWQLKEAIKADAASRYAKVKDICDELLSRADEMCRAQQLWREGQLPKRISHCDTKVNNILFDKDDNILCVIDLDTTMPGFVLSDFGDFIRTAGNKGAEDDPNLDNVDVNMEIFRAFADGYLSTATFLTPLEKSLLPYGAQMLTYMQTVRFLTDYLNGDTYYKTAYPEHNLVRTRAQLKLLHSIDAHMPEMQPLLQ